MANFINTNINQTVLMDINYLDQLVKNNFDFYLYSPLNQTNILDDFLGRYKNKTVGRKAYSIAPMAEQYFSVLSLNSAPIIAHLQKIDELLTQI